MLNRPLIDLVNIKKSSQGKTHETTMYVDIYEKQKARGKMDGWIPKDQIDSITTEVIEDDEPDEIVITQLVESDTEDTTEDLTDEEVQTQEIDIDLLELPELKVLCDEKGIKYHPAAKEKNLRKKLQNA